MSVPLAHYRQFERCRGVRLTCLGCMGARDVPLEVVIARLEARGVGGAQTGIKDVAKFVREPCDQCGRTTFDTSPAF